MAKQRIFLVLVDNTEEMKSALKFACLRANSSGGLVALAHVIEDSIGGENWLAVSDLSKMQAREDAEKLLSKYSDQVIRFTGTTPTLYIREGVLAEEVAGLVEDEKSISTIVLAASTSQANPGPVISYFLHQGIGSMRIPITIVPGKISDKVLEDLV